MVEPHSHQWLHVKDVLNRALELPPPKRNGFLSRACGDDPSLRREVESLLMHVRDAEKSEFLDERATIPTLGRLGETPRAPSASTLSVRCPHCHARIDVSVDAPLSNLVCQTCGEPFSLASDQADLIESETAARIGNFEFVERAGMGGFATVWKARDIQLDRTVAIKIPRNGRLSLQETAHFLREARAAAQLQHANIVHVHEVGRHEGCVYIVSDYIDGAPLSEWLAGQKLTSREAAALCLKIAAALDHAHQAGVIHRDLKPHNIMIDADGEPHLTDFGMARRTAGEVTMTLDGQVMGTPAYMSPEQARGDAHTADARSDVYSLGVILFELVTGEVPFRGNVQMVIHQVLHNEPLNPRQLNSNVDRDLDTICMKCLEKDSNRRYQSADEVQAEMRRFLDGVPVVARPVGRVSKSWRWCRRKPAVAALLATSIILLLSMALGATIAAWRFNEQNERVTANLNRAVDAEMDRRWRLFEAYLAQARSERTRRTDGRRFNALEAVRQAADVLRQIESDPTGVEQQVAELRNEAIAALALEDLRVDRLYRSEGSRVISLHRWDFDAEVKRFACTDGDGNLAILRVSDSQPEVTLPGRWRWDNIDSTPVTCFSPSGDHVAIRGRWSDDGESQQRTQLWNLATSNLMIDQPVRVTEHLNDLAFTADGKQLAFLRNDFTISVCDVDDGRVLASVELASPPYSIEFCPMTDRLVLCYDPDVQIVDWRRTRVDERLPATKPIAHAMVNSEGDLLAAACADGNVYLWERGDSWQQKRVFNGHQSEVRWVAFHPSSRLLASWSWDGTTRIWDLEGGSEVFRCEGHAVRFSQDGRWLGFASPGAEFGRWEVAAAEECRGVLGRYVDFSPCGRFLASLTPRAGATIWSVAMGRPCAQVGAEVATRKIFFHPTEKNLVTSRESGVDLWRYRSDAVPGAKENFELVHDKFLATEGVAIPSPTISGDGTQFAYKQSFDGEIVTVAAAPWSDRSATVTSTHDASGWFQNLSPDGRLAATGTRDFDYIYVWEVSSGETITKIEIPGIPVAQSDFSPDGRWLVVSLMKECVFYSTDTWQPRVRIPNETEGFSSFAFSPDGELLAISQKYYVSLRNPSSFVEVARLASKNERPLTVPYLGPGDLLDFSPDGRYLAVGTIDNTVQLWDLQLLRGRLAEMKLDW